MWTWRNICNYNIIVNLSIECDCRRIFSYLYIRLGSELFATNVACVRLSVTVSEHMFPHVTRAPQLFVTNVALVVAAHVVHLGHVVLVVSLVVKLILASLARVGLRFAGTYLQMCLQIAVGYELFFTTLTLESFSL